MTGRVGGMITVVGMDGSPLESAGRGGPASATLVVGGRRHLAALPALAAARSAGVRTVVLGELAPALDALAAHEGDAVVLASGDPGFFGIVRALRERGLAAVVLPGGVLGRAGLRPRGAALGRRRRGQRARP